MNVPLNVKNFLDRAERVFPDRVAVIDEPDPPGGSIGTITYRELAQRARGLACRLDELGVGLGERVAVVSPNAAQFLTAFYGVSAFGRVMVPINFRLTQEEIGFIVEHSGASVLLVDPELDQLTAGLEVKHRFILGRAIDAELFGRNGEPLGSVADENSHASVNYTSGTTARPKGVCLTHRGLWLSAATFGWHTGVSDRDVYLHTLPTFHANGWGMPYSLAACGVPQVILRKVDGEEILARIAAHGVTLMCGAPAVVAAILSAAEARRERGEEVPGRGQVRMIVAGAPPPSKQIERFESELGWEFIQIYGLTETSPLVTVNRALKEWDELEPADRARRLSRAGVPALGVELKLDDEGEVLMHSNHVFEGYWEQPEQTAAAIRDGWFHTGDGGYFDGSYLTLQDRKKDVIITGAENVSSIEVEDCLYQHPAVAEVAVIGVPDEKWGETVKALVVLREGEAATEADLIAFARDRMAHFKCPTSVEIRESLARTATGKLQKFKLRAPYWAGRERLVN